MYASIRSISYPYKITADKNNRNNWMCSVTVINMRKLLCNYHVVCKNQKIMNRFNLLIIIYLIIEFVCQIDMTSILRCDNINLARLTIEVQIIENNPVSLTWYKVEYVFDSHLLTFVSTMIYENTYYTKNYHYTLKVCTHKKMRSYKLSSRSDM